MRRSRLLFLVTLRRKQYQYRLYNNNSIEFEKNIIYEDNHLLVCNKFHGLLSQSGNSNDEKKEGTIIDHAKLYLKEKYQKPYNAYIGLVHRLDRPTSGVLILSKTSKSLSRLNESFRLRQDVKKFYVCMVNGELNNKGKLINYMIKNNDEKRVKCYNNRNDIKYGNIVEAELKYNSIVSKKIDINNQIQSLIDIEMITGRKHQIRSQLSHLGYPIVGDAKYNASQSFKTKEIYLHCYGIIINHPITNKKTYFSAKPNPSYLWERKFGIDILQKIDNLITEKRDLINI